MADASLSLNLQQVIDSLTNHQALTSQQRHSYIQSIEKICRWLSLPADRVPARRLELRPAIARLNASQLGIKKKTLSNTVSSLNAALNLMTVGEFKLARQQPDAIWVELLEKIDVPWRHDKIRQLARWASAQGIVPAEITEETFADWLTWRAEYAPLSLKPERAVDDALASWNWCAKHLQDWPTVVIECVSRKKRVRLNRDQLPDALVQELDAYATLMTRQKNEDLLAPAGDDQVKAVTAKVAHNRILAIEMCAAALVDGGDHKVEALTGIADIVCADHAHKLINWIRERNGEAYTHYHRTILEHLRAVSAQYIGFENMPGGDKERRDFNRMIDLVSQKVGHGKMTVKNRKRLTQFDDPENIARIVNLPSKVFYRLETMRQKTGFVTCHMAYEARAAIAITILLTFPLRRANVVGLRIGKELQLPKTKRDSARIVVDGAEVKNDEDLTCLVPEAQLALIETYLTWYRPVLIAAKKSDAPSDMCFGEGDHYLLPIKGGAPIDGGKLRDRLVRLVQEETGIDVTIHFFRNFAASMIMKSNPALAAAAGAVLGHKDGSRVTRVYAKVSSSSAADVYETVKQDLTSRRRGRKRPHTSRLNKVRRSHVR